jgi:type I restriction enzyme S subunit
MSSKTKTTATKEEATPALVPKLRFPEFRKAEAWDASILGELSEVVRGGSPRPIDGFITTSEDGLNWLKIGDVDKEAKYVTSTAEKVRPEALSKTRVVNPGDLILSNSMSFGRPYILQITTCIHDGWIAITKISKKTDRDFLYYLISAPSSQSYFLDNAAGSGVLNLNADIIKALRVSFPKAPEQQKIAECLGSVDELMAAQARKVDALKTHKKGLMQQLFPREGETQPRLRFPEFQDAGEWEAKTLVDACRMQAGKFVAAADIKEQNAGDLFPCYGGNGLRGFTATHTHDGVFPLIGRQGALCGNIKLATGRFHATEHAVVATPNRGVEVVWLYYLLDLLNLNRFATGQAQPGLSVDVLEKVAVTIPNDEREQQRIASCLSSLDNQITAETQKHEALKTHKKGLMQQLFPSPEEVAG